ncbi:MAG: type II secretion system major pseudopilin GspG [Planctomycetota bacterium]|jgi:general secretion pathway protein G
MDWKRRKEKAFTIVELLVVILIISMLAAFVAPKMFKGLGKARKDIARAKMANIEAAVSNFFVDCGRYPDQSEGLDILLSVAPPEDVEEEDWHGPYLKKSELLDPWGNPYIYVEEGEVNPGSFDLISLGADGQEDGEADNADIFND